MKAKIIDFGRVWEGFGRGLGRIWGGKRKKKRRIKESKKRKEKRERREEGRSQLSSLALQGYLYKGRLPWKPPLLIQEQWGTSLVCQQLV